MSKKYYISTPLYYVNDVPHLGHAYTTMAADAAARYHKMAGEDVFFLTGTDEHGQKLERSARAAGVDPQEYVDGVAGQFQALWERLDIRYDDFIRTTEERHHRGVHEILARMTKAGDIYKGSYEGLYCTGCEAFYTEIQLVDGGCPYGHKQVERLEEASYFFRLSRYQEPLLRLYRENPEFVRPRGRFNEVISFVEGGLKDLSITRTSVGWGIPYPEDEAHVLYVWLDALTNYISALGFGSEDTARYDRYWPADVHLIGKEILRFHAVYWPAFLLSAGLPLPRQVFAHGWLLAEEKKMSKSFGNVLDTDAFLNVLGADALRYCLLREVAFGQDGSCSDEAFVDRFNADLANDLGNLVSRATKMIGDYFDGAVPPARATKAGKALEEAAGRALAGYRTAMDRLEFHRALRSLWELVGAVNKYVDEQEPWRLNKEADQRERLGAVLYDCAEAIRWLGVLLSPIMPDTAGRIFAALGLDEEPAGLRLDDLAWGGLAAGGGLGPREPLFPRLDRAETMERIAEERKAGNAMVESKPSTKAQPKPTGESAGKEPFPEGTPLVSMSDFQTMDLRVATVTEADTVEGADKLIRMRVDLGTETRQIVAGLRPHYEPGEMVGKQIILVANLKPATIRGVRSEGMLLAATDGNKVVVAGFDRPVSTGSTVS